MSRADKLFRRLDELEAEYRALAAGELRRYLEDRWSPLLDPKIYRYLAVGRKWWDDKRRRIEWLEKEIDALRGKLGQPRDQSPAGTIRQLARRMVVERNTGRREMHPLIREVLRQWQPPNAPGKAGAASGRA